MPGVYFEYIKAGKFVVPVELTFQTETIQVKDDIRGLVNTSKWIERHNWKEIKAMLKPAVEACLKYNDTPLESIPKSHHISYGENVSLGYLIVANKVSTPFLSVLDTKKNCWTDDEDDEDELLGIRDPVRMEDHGAEFTEFIPTKTAIRVCVVRKSVVSIDDARRIRKELGVRSEDVRHYFSSATHLNNEAGPSSLTSNQVPENNQPAEKEAPPPDGSNPPRNNRSSDSEVENIPRTFGDPDEIRDAARIYTHVLNRDVDSGEDPDDDLSLPDIDPNPPKRKKAPRSRKKSTSLSPSKSKRLTHNNILALSQEGQANFSEEDSTYKRKKSKRKRTVAVVEPMRTLPNGQMSFEHAIGALSSDKRRKPRPGSSHGAEKAHSGGGRSKQPPAIDIIAPDDDRLTITNPPEPIPPVVTPASSKSPSKEGVQESEKKKLRKKRRRRVNIEDDPHKWERLTPSPLFDDDDNHSSDHHTTDDPESDLEMPVLIKMIDSDDEAKPQENQVLTSPTPNTTQTSEGKSEDETPTLNKQQNIESSPDITQIKTNAMLLKTLVRKKYVRKLNISERAKRKTGGESDTSTSSNQTASKDESREETVTQKLSQGSPNLGPVVVEAKITEESIEVEQNTASSATSASPAKGTPSSSDIPPEPATAMSREELSKSEKAITIKKLFSSTLKTPTRPKRKKRLKRVAVRREKVASNSDNALDEEKPKTGDAQTQTDDLLIIEQFERKSCSQSPALIKVSRSCDVSSEEEFCDMSQRSRTSAVYSETGRQATATPVHHPALGSPIRDCLEDDGLFSFESPTIPTPSQSSVCQQIPESENTEEPDQLQDEETTFTDESPEVSPELLPPSLHATSPEPPGSPQPGCSHWVTSTPTRPQSPPIIDLMPPPMSRPPRTPRKLFDSKLEAMSFNAHNQDIFDELEESGVDTMPVGTEASDVCPENVGRIYNLINEPNVFKAGLGLIKKVSSKTMTISELGRKLGLSDPQSETPDKSKALVPASSTVRKRDLSPDICELVPDKRLKLVVATRRSRRDVFDETSKSAIPNPDGSNNVVALRQVTTDDESSDIEGSSEAVLMEYISRCQGGSAYEPRGDEFDLSQRSYCMLNVVPQYELKSRLYKIHSKAIRETTVNKLVEHFKAIKPDLFGIFQGRIASLRHKIFLRGLQGRKDLRSLIVAVPFTSEQGTSLITLIYDHIVPDPTIRCQYIEYVNYVLVPEAFIRIYSRINSIPFHIAETEMRFRACYEGELPEVVTLPALE